MSSLRISQWLGISRLKFALTYCFTKASQTLIKEAVFQILVTLFVTLHAVNVFDCRMVFAVRESIVDREERKRVSLIHLIEFSEFVSIS